MSQAKRHKLEHVLFHSTRAERLAASQAPRVANDTKLHTKRRTESTSVERKESLRVQRPLVISSSRQTHEQVNKHPEKPRTTATGKHPEQSPFRRFLQMVLTQHMNEVPAIIASLCARNQGFNLPHGHSMLADGYEKNTTMQASQSKSLPPGRVEGNSLCGPQAR